MAVVVALTTLKTKAARDMFVAPGVVGLTLQAVPGKTIWLLWLPGWPTAPWIVQQVQASWRVLNPEWNVELLDERNIAQYVDVISRNPLWRSMNPAVKSDIVRLAILAEHGGVWADASMLCMHPLDTWIYDALQPTGFWMYHGQDFGVGPESSFMISLRASYIARAWKHASDQFWLRRRASDVDPLWLHGLFKELCEGDPVFRREWQHVPYLWCEERGQSHTLEGRVFSSDPALMQLIAERPPYVLQLTHAGRETVSDIQGSNAYAAIQVAFTQPRAPYPQHSMKQLQQDTAPFADTVVILADCGHAGDMTDVLRVCSARGVQPLIYDKCNFCKHVPDGVYCRPLPNLGREMHTYAHFMFTHYDTLPRTMFLQPLPFAKYDRLERFIKLLQTRVNECTPLAGDIANFQLDDWQGKPVQKADTRPFRAWYERYVGNWDDAVSASEAACYNGIMMTTRERIKRHPRLLYWNICKQLDDHNSPETGHYLERSMGLVF